MKLRKVSIDDLTTDQINYAVSVIERHESRYDLESFESYTRWQSMEQSFGNPIKPYCTEWKYGGYILESHEISVIPIADETKFNNPFSHWMASVDEIVHRDKSCLIASMKCVISTHYEYNDIEDYDYTVLVPVSDDIESKFLNKLNSLSPSELKERLENCNLSGLGECQRG